MANNEQIRKLIRQIVREEVQKVLPSLLSEVFTGLMTESLRNAPKRRTLNEASYGVAEELEEYPTMGHQPAPRGPMDRSRMATLMGYGDVPRHDGARASNGRELIVSSAVTEHGTAIPVDPSTLPDHVVDALTKNYGDFMKVLNEKTASKNHG